MQSTQEIPRKGERISVPAEEFVIRNAQIIKHTERAEKMLRWLERGIRLDLITWEAAEQVLREEKLYA